jgi:hypothetical protein
MPVVTAVKRWREFPRRRNIHVVVEDMTDLVRIFFLHARQRELRESLPSMSVESLRNILSGDAERRK